jgi:hypothetical protein
LASSLSVMMATERVDGTMVSLARVEGRRNGDND